MAKTKLQIIREQMGLDRFELANHVSRGSDQSISFWIFLISAYEKREIEIVNTSRLSRLALALQCQYSDLKENDGEQNK
ncbi:helix-turn-helix transcriptional regulator (plasmid) [Lactococcus petauri]|nr:helix-turn-helix transcriptional regulator [Lactococcus petauri]